MLSKNNSTNKSVCNLANNILVASFPELDSCISDDVFARKRVLKGFKCGKTTGLENVLNEYFVKFKDIFQPLLVKI